MKPMTWIVAVAALLGATLGEAQLGGKIAFIENKLAAGPIYNIYTMDTDGGNVQRLADLDFSLRPGFYALSWSPDGNKLAFYYSKSIFLMNADGTNLVQLTNLDGSAQDTGPAWSPDGNRIAFTRTQGAQSDDIFVVNADGSNLVNLTNSGSRTENEMYPCWSPDGTRIVYAIVRHETVPTRAEFHDLYMMKADGSNRVRLTSGPTSNTQPRWSPDGSRILYLVVPDWTGLTSDLALIDPDGGNPVQLTANTGWNEDASWSPDGSRIIFASTREGDAFPGSSSLFMMDADGSNVIEVLHGELGFFPQASAWSPGLLPSAIQPISWGQVKRESH